MTEKIIVKVIIVLFTALILVCPSSAASSFYFGPPNIRQNTVPGLSTLSNVKTFYPEYGKCCNPEVDCIVLICTDINDVKHKNYEIIPESTGAHPGIYDIFHLCNDMFNSAFIFNRFDGEGYCIGGEFSNTTTTCNLELEKSQATLPYYDKAHVWGNHEGNQLDYHFNLIIQDGYVAIQDPVDLQIDYWVPLGLMSTGQKTILLDLDGDGRLDSEFVRFPPLTEAAKQAIPTVNEWGLLILALVFLTTSVYVCRKRNDSLA